MIPIEDDTVENMSADTPDDDTMPCGCTEGYCFCEPDDNTDDGYALMSAGWGTDEDYGYYGNEDY